MRVFLTGGTGYLGSAVARQLRDGGHEVIAMVRSRERGASLLGCGASLVEGDLLEPGDWCDELASAEALVHTAGLVAAWGPPSEEFDRVNIDASLDLIDRARAAGLQRILVTGSFFAFGPSAEKPQNESAVDEPIHPLSTATDYSRSKAIAARKIRERQKKGQGVIMLFPTILLGPGPVTEGNHTATVISDIGRGKLPGLVGRGDQIWNLVPVESAARGHLLALEKGKPGENYILGGEDWTQRQLVESAARHFGRKAPLRKLGRRLPDTVALISELWASVSGRTPMLTRGSVALYDADWSASHEKAARDLGYQPEGVEETVAATVRWIRDDLWENPGR